MAKHKKVEVEKDNSERWLLTYADLMNLLLILFIIFYAMSQVDKEKAEAVAESIRSGFGFVEDGGTGAAEGEGTGLYSVSFEEGEGDASANGEQDASASAGAEAYWAQETIAYQEFYSEVVKLLEENDLQDMVTVLLDDRGVVISFKDNALYPSGSAELSSDSMSLIDHIGSLLAGLTFSFILVEGHTDTDPIHTFQYIDNMDLSTQRASNVWRELVKCGLSPDHMAPIGRGEFRPIANNDTPENKQKNRRVVITILRSDVNSTDEVIKVGGT